MNPLFDWWMAGWRTWEPNMAYYAESERMEKDLRSISKAAGDPAHKMADWIRKMREETWEADQKMVRLCKHQRVLMVAWVVVMVGLVAMPLWLRLLRRS
jgi:hypothetical protein